MKLASFEIIESLTSIKGKTKIMLAKILDYEVVVRKDYFNVGDYCVYVFCDTVLDCTKPYFQTFANKDNKFVVKSTKMCGYMSEGIAFPLSAFSDIVDIGDPNSLTETELEELDLGSLIGVSKYEKEASITESESVTTQPSFPLKYYKITDEDNIKGKKNLLTEIVDKELIVTVKQDGSSMTLIWDDDIFMVCSRRFSLYKCVGDEVEYDYPSFIVDFVKSCNIRDLFRNRRIVIQGEFCGPKVNCNKLSLDHHMMFVFTIFDLNEKIQIPRIDEFHFGEMHFSNQIFENENIKPVPFVKKFTFEVGMSIKVFDDIVKDVKYVNPNTGEITPAEGIVVRPIVPFYSHIIHKDLSFKFLNPEYKD